MSIEQRLATLATHIETAENAMDRVRYHFDKLREELAAEPAPEPMPEPTPTPAPEPEPEPTPAPAPAPTPTPTPTPTPPPHEHPPATGGWVRADSVTPIASDFDVNDFLQPSGIPGPAPFGANFRLLANPSHLNYDDPIVYPGQPGAAHLHHFFGNRTTNAFSTYQSLRADPRSTTSGNMINGSAYWVPALLDGRGNVVNIELISLYYKTDEVSSRVRGLPAGLRILMRERRDFWLESSRGGFNRRDNLEEILAAARPGDRIGMSVASRAYWDGVHIDSPNHMDHLSEYPSESHPFHIPRITYNLFYRVVEGDDPMLWRLSSDMGAPAGSTLHGDFIEAWDPSIREAWTRNIILAGRDANNADLGDGRRGVEPPDFSYADAEPHLIPIPPHNH